MSRKALSVALALALSVTSFNLPFNEKNVSAYSVNETLPDTLSADYVKDPDVLALYRIIANVVKDKGNANATAELSEKTAAEILADDAYAAYKSDATALVSNLNGYSGKLDFSGFNFSTGDITGIGIARGVSEINLIGATFSTTLTKIPNDEFAGCSSLVKISVPDTVKEIGNNAFQQCYLLTTYKSGSEDKGEMIDLTGVEKIGSSAFRDCKAFTSLEFLPYSDDKEVSIGADAFYNCASLETVEIPVKSADNLAAGAFQNCLKLSKVSMYDEMDHLNATVFQSTGTSTEGVEFSRIGMSDTKSTLPSSLKYIGASAFSSANLEDLDMSNCKDLTEIGDRGFSGTHIQELILPENLTTIGNTSFQSFDSPYIEIPSKCVNWGSSAFMQSKIIGIKLPDALEELPLQSFAECDYLDGRSISFESEGNSKLKKIDDLAFAKASSLVTTGFLATNCKELKEIGKQAFSACTIFYDKLRDDYQARKIYGYGLERVILPDSVEKIGEGAFEKNYTLRTAYLGEGIINIPENLFANEASDKDASRLEKVVLSSKLESIGNGAFANQTKLTTIGYGDEVKDNVAQFPNSLYTIGNSAFLNCGTSVNKSVVSAQVFLPIDSDAIKDEATDGYLECLVYDYENNDPDNGFVKKVYIDDSKLLTTADLKGTEYYSEILGTLTTTGKKSYQELDVIAYGLYVNFTDAYSIRTSDYNNEFKYNTGIYNYVISDTDLTGYDDSRLYNLSSVYVSDEDAATFVSRSEKSGYEKVWAVPGDYTKIPNAKLNAESKITYNSGYVNYRFGLKDVNIPDSVKPSTSEGKEVPGIGEGAFQGCKNLGDVKLSKNIQSIEKNTFADCGGEEKGFKNSDEVDDYFGLENITIPDSVLSIGENAFKGCMNMQLGKTGSSSFGNKVETIGKNAFNQCYTIDNISFPASLKTIEDSAFSQCAEQYKDKGELTSSDGKQKYTYTINKENFGTRTKKAGLKNVDFSYASGLENIGSGAFILTNVETVNLTNAKIKELKSNLFDSCTYLQTITIPSSITKLNDTVFKDNLELKSVTLPETAVISDKSILGYNKTINSFLKASQKDEDKDITIPLDSEDGMILPVKLINKTMLEGDIKVEADFGNGNGYENILTENGVGGITATIQLNGDNYEVRVFGKERHTSVIKLKVEYTLRTYNPNENFNTYSKHTMSHLYNVKVSEVPTSKVDVRIDENDATYKKSPEMLTQTSTGKTIYVPANSTLVNNGISLVSYIYPGNTTEITSWTCDNEDLFDMSSEVVRTLAQDADGVDCVKEVKNVKLKADANNLPKVGAAKITFASGDKTETVQLYSRVVVTSNSNIVLTSSGNCLGATNSELSSSNKNMPFSLKTGDKEQLNINLDVSNTKYTDEEKSKYVESYTVTSSDEKVIKYSATGELEAVGEGEATLTIKTNSSGLSKILYFSVSSGANYSASSIVLTAEGYEAGETPTVKVGSTIKINANVSPSQYSGKIDKWEAISGGGTIINIDEDGVVTGLNSGTAKIRATITNSEGNGKTITADLTINVITPITEFRLLDVNDVTVEVNNSVAFTATNDASKTGNVFFIGPNSNSDDITWTSSDNNVAKVTGNKNSCRINGVALGNAVITGTTKSGLKVEITVHVGIKVKSIKVDSSITLDPGKTHQLVPVNSPENATEIVKYSYKSSNESVATVSPNGLIMAVAKGSARITVTTDTNLTAYCNVTVTGNAVATAAPGSTLAPTYKIAATKIQLLANKPNMKKFYMAKGQTLKLGTKLTPSNSDETVSYVSGNTSVCTVDSSGTIKALKKGSAKITATTASGKTASVTVKVLKKAKKAKKVKVKGKKKIKVGKKLRLTIKLKPANATVPLKFKSNKSGVLKVDKYGFITAKKKGKAKITVKAGKKKGKITIKVKK